MLNRIAKILLLFTIVLIIFFGSKSIFRRLYPLNYTMYISLYANKYSIDPYLVAAVIRTESKFDINATSSKNAAGLMQITEETGKWIAEQMKITDFNTKDLYNPEINIKMGCWYLDNLKQEFNGNMEVVLAAYNGGRGNVKNWLGNNDYSIDGQSLKYIPFKETDEYIKRVRANYNIYKYMYRDFR